LLLRAPVLPRWKWGSAPVSLGAFGGPAGVVCGTVGSAAERDWFRLLTGVQGVGGRVALNILSVLDESELSRAVGTQDKAMVARANGVGPKLAERIVRELKDKVGGVAVGMPGVALVAGAAADAVSALLNLGFRPAEASAAVAKADEELGGTAGLDALVRVALKKVAR
jgi:Holliday junction DNA helicase RuvA